MVSMKTAQFEPNIELIGNYPRLLKSLICNIDVSCESIDSFQSQVWLLITSASGIAIANPDINCIVIYLGFPSQISTFKRLFCQMVFLLRQNSKKTYVI